MVSKMVALVFILVLSSYGLSASVEQNLLLLKNLQSSYGWEMVHTHPNGWTLSRKRISHASVYALSVTGMTDATPKQII
ncbi:MAG: hypothetical protein N2450_09725 [bacterium]|nr:hypothetical protein [bacterium]